MNTEGASANRDNSWANARAREFLASQGTLSEKVGVVSSRSRVGRGAQAVGTMLAPGDLSDVRSPIRSTIAEALTPGGGRGG